MKLPPLRALQCFEAVARLNSFSKAADQLNVTQSAVSHQVKLLEEYLGEAMFSRYGRSFALTEVGERYFEEVSHSLSDLSNASQLIREGQSGKIRLALYSSVAVKWLIPRLEDLRQQYPEIELSLNMMADEPKCSDQVADCFITVEPPKTNFVVEFLYAERLYPVCGHKLWQQIKDKLLPEALWKQPLLSVQNLFPGDKPGEDWRQWSEQGGFELPANTKINHFSHMLLAAEAARYDQGITLINHYLMSDQDRQHNFVRIPMHEVLTGDNFYFVYKKSRAKQTDIVKLGRWLKQQCLE
ncbi:LysR substrate-binding domain-containing protein [Pseudoalteromonas denitrificans]|jgi:DNA-binding transcriptional LysR family regulator|uniref:DNA-binding transcriptional regulator, LysR family n=1 Tax=Pseudoalteromonas denitrificans DSM 6059 TaxID=1123010 RepID=A0A1I1R5N9_9GAMM|nr:LysR substrate-binding domain-containing protein [Pseudoalteromonas denitrificans]SFD27458.1 DNA-binding transcriptional regulator, LysR family [Pseudoalteromonas denitrificans DSM 6059]